MQGNHRRELGLQFEVRKVYIRGALRGFYTCQGRWSSTSTAYIYIYILCICIYIYIYIDSYIVSIDRGRRVASFEVYRAGMSWQIRLLGGCC